LTQTTGGRIMKGKKMNTADYIPISNRSVTKKLFYDEIIYIEKDYHELVFATVKGNVYIRGSCADLKKYTERCKELYECHSYLASIYLAEDGFVFPECFCHIQMLADLSFVSMNRLYLACRIIKHLLSFQHPIVPFHIYKPCQVGVK
jgi:hypothetical protein